MTQATQLLVCDCCEDVVTGFERGWRAYLVDDGESRSRAKVLCPRCGELFGEDEAEWSEPPVVQAPRPPRPVRGVAGLHAGILYGLALVAPFWAAVGLLLWWSV